MAEIEITRQHVEEWIDNFATGEFHYTSVCGLRNRLEPSQDGKLRKIIYDICHSKGPTIESVGRNDGYYRPIQNGVKPLEFNGSSERKSFPIVFPFNLRQYVHIYPDTTSIVAGSKSAGKSGWLYRVVAMNREKVNTILLSNMEGGKDQMYDRFKAMGIDLTAVPPFIYPVSDNFHDYIKERDTIYVIDYIDAPEGIDFYVIGAAIAKVDKKLQGLNSVAVVGLQKPFGRDTAFGGEQTLKVATMYLAMNDGMLKIVDAKVHTDKKVNPKNMKWSFLYDDEGTNFINIQRSYESE